ncbi:MAG: Bug family tripartite tricarboxylate transporter substrate binding protein, partial [Xanthobacteraceae bacterium]
ACIGPAWAQDWPSRPVTLVVAFPAGGSDDILGRIVAARLSELLRQPVNVENIGGAGGMTGTSRVVKAAPDGYQVALGTSATHAVSQVARKTPLYDSLADFTPVALIAEQPFALIARKDLPADGLREFIAYAKANETKMQYGSAGAGSATHLVCALLDTAIGIKARHVPYDGGAPALRDLVDGRIDYFCPVVTIAIPQIEKKSVKAIAILSKNRAPILPTLASAAEQGLTDFTASTWFAIFLPKGTPEPIVRSLHAAIMVARETPAVQARLKDIGADLVAPERRSPDYLQAFIKNEIAKWAAAIKAANLAAD